MDPIAMAAIEAERTAKLPVWAQNEIARLKANEQYYQERIAALLAPAGEATVTRGYNPGVPVGSEHDTFRFYLPSKEGQRFRSHLDVRLDEDGVLQVSGDGRLVVYPHASNVIHIALGRN